MSVAITALGPWGAPLLILRDAYVRARNQNKSTIFFLTLLGVVTTLIGTGYLLQLGFNVWLSIEAKLAAAQGVSLGASAVGTRLWKRKSFQDFGSALIGLGIAMSYLVVYFATKPLQVVAPLWGFAGLATITGLAFGLARAYKTKIVSSVMLFGGALAPFLLDLTVAGSPFYLGFLLALCLASLTLSRLTAWPSLGTQAFALSATILEFGAFGSDQRSLESVQIVLLEAFHALFAFWVLFDGRRLVRTLPRFGAALLCANAAVLASTLWSQVHDVPQLAVLLGLNSVPYIALGLASRSHARSVAGGLLAIAAAFFGLAVAVASDLDTMGLLLAHEALLFVFLGVRWDLKTLRREGYVLVFGSLILGAMAWKVTPFSAPWLRPENLNLMTMGFTIGVLQFLTRRYSASTGQLAEDSQVYRISGEVGFLWFAGASLWVLTSLFPLYGWACCVVPMALLIGRGERRRWPLTTAVGLALCGALVVPAFRSIALVESVRFSQQMPWGKLAFAEVLAVLWVAPLYVARLATASPFLTALRRIQTAVYLALPFVWLPTAARRWPEFQLLLPWGSALISGALALGLKKPSLKFERWILTTLAAGSSLIGAVDETHSLAQFTLGSWLG